MYFVFQSQMRNWGGGLLQAVVQSSPQFEPHWWLAQPFTLAPSSLTFTLNAKAPKPDNYFTGTLSIELYSIKLINLLIKAGVKNELLPAKIIDRKSKENLPLEYKAFHLLEIYPGWDRNQSIVDEKLRVTKLVLTEECLTNKRPFFRIEKLFLILIHEDLKKTLDNAGITGCVYIPVEDYRYRNFYEY